MATTGTAILDTMRNVQTDDSLLVSIVDDVIDELIAMEKIPFRDASGASPFFPGANAPLIEEDVLQALADQAIDEMTASRDVLPPIALSTNYLGQWDRKPVVRDCLRAAASEETEENTPI